MKFVTNMHMKKSARRGIEIVFWIPCFLFLLATVPTHAIKTRSIHKHTYAEFIQGELEHLSLSQHGELRLGPTLEEVVELEEPIVFDAVVDSQGNLFLGSGNKGLVYKVDPEGEVTTYFEPEEILIRALAIDSKDNLYVGTAPDGRIYRIRPNENPEVYFNPKTTYIWDLLMDAEDNLYLSTGSPAKIFKLPADHKLTNEVEPIFATKEEHISVMVQEAKGTLLAGTSPSAFLYRIDENEKSGEVLHNANADEITAIFPVESGDIYFSTMGKGSSDGNKTPLDLPELLEKLHIISQPTATTKNNGKKTANSKSKSTETNNDAVSPSFLFRLQPTGFAEPIWSPGSANIYSLSNTANKQWLVGADSDGRLYQVADSSEWKLYQQAAKGGDISVILQTETEDPTTYIITSNPAVIYKLASSVSEKGTYQSSIIDAKQVARWGNIRPLDRWPSSAEGVEWSTRTGNTPDPDKTWSEWTPTENLVIQSPHGRYLQYKAELNTEEALVRDVRIFYNLYNIAPIVSRVNVVPVGIRIFDVQIPKKNNANLSQLINGGNSNKTNLVPRIPIRQQFRVTGEQGGISFGWRAIDPNDDQLRYTLAIKAENAESWSTLAEDLKQSAYSMNTRGYSDGYYRVQVTASDHLSNPPEEGKSGRRISHPFLIDNTQPTITQEQQKTEEDQYILQYTIKDQYSIIQSATYILDGQPSRPLLPDDTHYDEQNETFTIRLEKLSSGPHSLVLEASDESGNIATIQTNFTID